MQKHANTFFLIFVLLGLVILGLIANFFAGGKFLDPSNLRVVISHIVYPAFAAWGLCFLFACGFTDMSVGGVLVLGAFASTWLGNALGYPGVALGAVAVGVLLIFFNFNVFAFTKIPSWIAGISLAMIYEAIAVFLKVNPATKPYVDTELSRNFRLLGQLPYSVILLAIGFTAAYVLYNRTSIGLNIRAIGGNRNVARAMGINVNRTLLAVGVIAGIFFGLSAMTQISYSGRMTVKTGLTSMNLIFQPLAIVLLAQIMQKRINIIIAVPICSLVIYSIFNLLTIFKVPSGTLQEAALGLFLIAFAIVGQRGTKAVVK
jgi:ribose transport system permease protein